MGDAQQLFTVDGHRSGDCTVAAVRLLVAPDKFKGTLTARQAAEAIERGWRRERPHDDVQLMPLADGGDGTLDVLAPADGSDGSRRIRARVSGPLGDPVEAEFGIRGATAIVEMARASGLELVPEPRRDVRRATTRGTGELVRAALDAGATTILVCVGGSATNDGGVGFASALGVRFLDATGEPVRDGGAALVDLVRIDLRPGDHRLTTATVVGVTDVDNPLCGAHGASAVYGPQKGADPATVGELDRALGHLAAVVHRDLGLDLADEPGAGAAGGLGFGLLAFAGARLRRGVDVVMETLRFDERLDGADLVMTGEGSFDAQSMRGKVPDGVIRAAQLAGVPCAIVCGRAEAAAPDGVALRSLVQYVGPDAAMSDARGSLERLASDLAAEADALVADRAGRHA
jgi:glycerate kinase